MIALVEVGVGGLVGAPARFVMDQVITSKTKGLFPWGTFWVNALGAFILGLLDGLISYHGLGTLPSDIVGTGFCGAFTTFSTFSYETVRLLEENSPASAIKNIVGSLTVGLLAAGAGLSLAML